MQAQELILLFTQNSNPKVAEPMAKYMKHHFEFYGIPAPIRKQLQKEFIQAQKKLKTIDWTSLYYLWEHGKREVQIVVLDCLWQVKQKLKTSDLPHLQNLIETHSWWDSVDSIDQLVGVLLKKDPATLTPIIVAWSIHSNFWVRRVSINCQLGFRLQTNWELLRSCLLNNLQQKQFFIAKAVGWSLREYAKYAPETVIDFLNTHQKIMQPLSIREANKYLKVVFS
jgi:3-methyladenine DNA glycosylase AlkD